MTASGRGVLFPTRLPEFRRVPASGPVADLVRWFWIPEWDLPPGQCSRQEVVAYPASNLVVEPHLVGLSGPTTRRSHRDLTGHGWAVGALLRPAAVGALVDDPTGLVDGYRQLELPDLHEAVARAMRQAGRASRHEQAVRAFSDWLRLRVPRLSEEARLANALADLIEADRSVLRLADVSARLGVSSRSAQRLARRYVGIPPAAMIRRRRLQEAAERIRSEPGAELAGIAAELGYADQAHLTRDFRAVLGHTPSRYRSESP